MNQYFLQKNFKTNNKTKKIIRNKIILKMKENSKILKKTIKKLHKIFILKKKLFSNNKVKNKFNKSKKKKI